MNTCSDTYAFALVIVSLALFGASVFQLWRHQEKANPVVREIRFAQDTAPMPYVEGSILAISKTRAGGPPYFTFPPDVQRKQIETLYDVVIREGKPPLEKHMLPRLTRRELRAVRDHFYQEQWAEYLRDGMNAPWKLTAQGEKNLIFFYMRLNGKLPYEGHEHQRRIPCSQENQK